MFLPPNEVDIERILNQLRPRPAKPELRRLDFKHRAYWKRVQWTGTRCRNNSYVEWFESPVRERWKLCKYSVVSGDLSDTATQSVRQEFGKEPYNWISTALPRVRENDWVLCIYTRGKQQRRLYWLFADRVLAIPRIDRNFDPECPYEVIQIHRPKQYPPPPFSIGQRFREAAIRVLLSSDLEDLDTPCALATGHLRALYAAMQ